LFRSSSSSSSCTITLFTKLVSLIISDIIRPKTQFVDVYTLICPVNAMTPWKEDGGIGSLVISIRLLEIDRYEHSWILHRYHLLDSSG
jgi:hypothetical protein